VGGADTRLDVIPIGIESSAAVSVYSGEPEPAVDFVAGKQLLVDLRGDRVQRRRVEATVQSVVAFGERPQDVPAQADIHGGAPIYLDVILHPGSVVAPTEIRAGDVIHAARRRRAEERRGYRVSAQGTGREIVGAGKLLVEGECAAGKGRLVIPEMHQPQIDSG